MFRPSNHFSTEREASRRCSVSALLSSVLSAVALERRRRVGVCEIVMVENGRILARRTKKQNLRPSEICRLIMNVHLLRITI